LNHFTPSESGSMLSIAVIIDRTSSIEERRCKPKNVEQHRDA
jgi:hypothetical protein